MEQSGDRYHLAIQDGNWSLRFPHKPNVIVNRDGYRAIFTQSRTGDGVIVGTLRLDGKRELLSSPGNQALREISRLGTLLFPEMITFIDRQRSDAKREAPVEIDGLTCEVLSWDIKPLDYDEAFLIIPNQIADEKGGTLQIFISPEAGYAIPRYRYNARDGTVCYEVACRQLKPLGEDVYYPAKATITNFENGEMKYQNTFESLETPKINQPIDDSAFDIEVPIGTSVVDKRIPLVPFRYVTTEPTGLKKLAQ